MLIMGWRGCGELKAFGVAARGFCGGEVLGNIGVGSGKSRDGTEGLMDKERGAEWFRHIDVVFGADVGWVGGGGNIIDEVWR